MVGKTLLHYEIRDQIGKGGMGEVFAAHDTKLGRDVALKILPADLTGDPEREARFQREARALASLQHPNVASVYGFEEAEGVRFLVMELVSGVELTARMADKAMDPDEVRRVARQLAAGLEAAHETGIVHRDLKPANVMVTEDGEVKILDFGLAQAWFGEGPEQSESSAMPTITAAMTQVGSILGTAAYMSPEQARGISVDRRTDIWAFGVILFEMLAGKPLFQGETVSDTLAAVLRKVPDWDELPVDDAPALCRLVERCLERNPKQRLRDIGEARIFLEDGTGSSSHLSFSMLGAAAVEVEQKRPVWVLAAIAAVALFVGAGLGWQFLAQPEPVPVIHAMIPPPGQADYDLRGAAPGPAAVSPDGSMIAFTALDATGTTLLYLRHLDQGEAVAMSGTAGAAYPFWSPDNRYIGYFEPSNGKLRKVATAGGPPVTLCAATNGKGGTWNEAGQILFAADASAPLSVVPEIGGEPVPATRLASGYNSHRHPRFLPGGRQFLFTARRSGSGFDNDIMIATMDTTVPPRVIVTSQANADYANGHLLTVREGVLMATPFDPDAERVTEGGTPLVENVMMISGAAVAVFDASESGVIAFQTGGSSEAGQVVMWTDIATGAKSQVGDPGQIYHPMISPDGTRAVVEVRGVSNEGADLWMVELDTGLRTRFTFASGDETLPRWSPDGQTIYYAATGAEMNQIVEQPVEGQGGAAIVLESERFIGPSSVSPDGRYLLLDWELEDGTFEMRRLDLTTGGGEPEVLATVERSIGGGQYSPDGRWIAYHTQTAAGWDVFVMSASGGARKWQITTDGSAYPRWNHDGSELWVSPFNGEIRAYAVEGQGQTFRVGSFRATVTTFPPDATGCYYDLHPDGQRVLQSGPDPEFRTEVSNLHLVTDWRRALVQ